ncbi:MAG: hypothetical protein GY710_24600 [Desulfobacteraceae bacterium]|nr:hypothetical protein [Desulfobacteraceae bacterium]
MSLITAGTHNTNNLYQTPNEKIGDLTPGDGGEKLEKESLPSVRAGDRVTFSKEVAVAKTREALGLNPTGRLTFLDFETAAINQEQTVESVLASFKENLGVEKDQKISLSLDAQSNIVIKESFAGKTKLEKKLNEDEIFSREFKSMSANNEFLDYVQNLQMGTAKGSTNLFSVMNSGSDLDEMLSLAATKYSDIKSSDNSLATLLSISKSQTPYTFTHDPGSTADNEN